MRLKKFVVRSLATLGALVLLELLGIGIYLLVKKGHVPAQVILEADFEQGLVEYVPDDPVAKALLGRSRTVRNAVEALERAREDKRVVGLVARVGESGLALAQVQELRDAVAAFRTAGKPAIAWAETFSEGASGNGAYYLATAFDEIWLQPSGGVGLTGLLRESMFLRGTLDKLGFEPRLAQRYEYKNAMNLFTERQYTAAHREAVEKLTQSQFDQLVTDVARDRHLPAAELPALIDRGPFLGTEASEAKLVDHLAYRDEVYAHAKAKWGKDARLLYLGKYLERAGRPHDKGDTIALIYGVGEIKRGKNRFDPVMQTLTLGSDSVAAAFRAAAADKQVKAIIFRIDSPGGSYVASDTIWHETVKARAAGKPVIASMGAVAGSGGYFVAMSADKIVAQPATITGSIGVLSGKFLTTNFWGKLGVSWDEVHTSTNATMATGLQDYTPAQWAQFQRELDTIYADFTDKVAAGRKLPKEKVLAIAKGRIWTGADAKELGLVDELGGFPVALRLARAAAGLAADAPVKIVVYPAPKKLLDQYLGEGPDNSEPASAVILAESLRRLAPVARVVRPLLREPDETTLRMPETDW